MAVSTTEAVRDTIGASSSTASSRTLRWFMIPAGLLILGLIGALWNAHRASGATITPYETATLSRGDLRVAVTATGSLEAITTVEVGAEVTGRLASVLVDTNDPVKKGQLLAVLDPEQLQAAVDESSAQVASAAATIAQTKATLVEAAQAAERAKEQTKQGLISARDLEGAIAAEARARASVASATANATLARATLNQAQLRLGKTKIVSPIDGIVLARRVQPGQTVTAGFQTPVLFKLAQDLTQMRLNVAVEEADVGRVHEQQQATFTVEAYPGRSFSSRVLSLDNDPKTSQHVVTFQAVLSVDNGDRSLRPGMTCTATIVANTRTDVLLVPNAALRFSPPAQPGAPIQGTNDDTPKDTQRVWLLQGATPTPLNVRVGATDGTQSEVVSGSLHAGMRVIVDITGE